MLIITMYIVDISLMCTYIYIYVCIIDIIDVIMIMIIINIIVIIIYTACSRCAPGRRAAA